MAALHYTKLAGCIALSITPRIHLDEYPKICNSPTSAIIALIRIPDVEVKALTISHIENVLKEETPRIHHGENQSERTIVCLPETNARALISIQDENIKEKAISHIENVLKEETPRIHHGENQSERTIVCLPETNARPLLAISDPIIKEKAIIKCMERLNGEIGAGMAGCIALHYYSVYLAGRTRVHTVIVRR